MDHNAKPGGGFYPVIGTGLRYGSDLVLPIPYGTKAERGAKLWDIWEGDNDRYYWLCQLPEGGEVIRDISKAWEVNNHDR